MRTIRQGTIQRTGQSSPKALLEAPADQQRITRPENCPQCFTRNGDNPTRALRSIIQRLLNTNVRLENENTSVQNGWFTTSSKNGLLNDTNLRDAANKLALSELTLPQAKCSDHGGRRYPLRDGNQRGRSSINVLTSDIDFASHTFSKYNDYWEMSRVTNNPHL